MEDVDITGVVALASLCKAVLSAGTKAWGKYRNKKLSNEERELLLSAYRKEGTFHYMDGADQTPYPWIRAGGKDYPQSEVPSEYAKYLRAFVLLCKRGYIDNVSKILFVLTDDGFRKAEELEKEKVSLVSRFRRTFSRLKE